MDIDTDAVETESYQMSQSGLEEGWWLQMPERKCIRCEEFWPSDTEFYRTENSEMCIACEHESPPWRRYRSKESLERRRERNREYARNRTHEQKERRNIAARERYAKKKHDKK